jgi:hypothetical protein
MSRLNPVFEGEGSRVTAMTGYTGHTPYREDADVGHVSHAAHARAHIPGNQQL